MSNPRILFAAAVAVAVTVAAPASAAAAPSAKGLSHRPVCAAASAGGDAACASLVATNTSGTPFATTGPVGYGPADLRSAYGVSLLSGSSTQVVAVVVAYDYPTAAADLSTYRSTYGLPACTTSGSSPCFRKVNQRGQTTGLPKADAGWALEAALDLQMASAICPNCRLLLVEANSSSLSDLSTAVAKAASLGAKVINNSYGAPEFSSETSFDSRYNQPGVAVTAASGDSGYGVQYPAASPYVTAVGGTSLVRSTTTRGWSETAWSGAGSGCSAYEAKPTWQKDSGCAKRTVADVSAVADPSTGVAVYDTTVYNGATGWFVLGGTSVASPVIAGMIGLAGNASTVNTRSRPYSSTSALYDVSGGSNGTCSVLYLCTAVTGFDGPTGLGTPNGIAAF